MKTPQQIAQENINRLLRRDGIKSAQVARDFNFTPQNASALLKKKAGITDKFARRFCEKYGWDRSEIYRDIERVGKLGDVNDVLFDLITQLNKEDKKTVARLMIRMLNRPQIAFVITSKIIEHIDKS